jgi:hypothetical protein
MPCNNNNNIHCEAEYEHFTDNMFHSNTYIHLNNNH